MRIFLAGNYGIDFFSTWGGQKKHFEAMKIFLAGNGADDRLVSQMNIHLADTPPLMRLLLAQRAGHPYRLFSYFYIKQLNDPTVVSKYWEANDCIMDSGLFSFMFGAEKDTMPATLEAYDEYTRKYISDLDAWGYNGWLVESDTQRLLGMEATFELRKLFKDHEDRTIFVWHQPEGLDGLERLALRYDYIAISIPELRMISGAGKVGGGSNQVNRMTTDLLSRIHSVCRRKGKRPPKVHLLGCTVPKMMQTTLAWSCDSTSWLAGVRFGQGCVWRPRSGLKMVGLRSQMFAKYRELTMAKFPDAVAFANQQKNPDYYIDTLTCAHAFSQYQQWLDTRYSPVPTRGT